VGLGRVTVVGSGRGSHEQWLPVIELPPWRWVARRPSPRPELAMTVVRSVADVLDEHVTLEVECIDRMYLNLYQPRLQHVNGAVWFFRGHREAAFASSALMDPISKDFLAAIHRFCRESDVPMVEFARGHRKDDLAHAYLADFQATLSRLTLRGPIAVESRSAESRLVVAVHCD
jgi:hypothetical protein